MNVSSLYQESIKRALGRKAEKNRQDFDTFKKMNYNVGYLNCDHHLWYLNEIQRYKNISIKRVVKML